MGYLACTVSFVDACEPVPIRSCFFKGRADRPRPLGESGDVGIWRMAQRKAKTAKRPAKRPSRTTKAPSEAKLKLERIKSLEKERDVLKVQLEVAGERITSLEQGRDDVVNRIDWVIDSLHNAIESEA